MTASNWAMCPRCAKRRDAELVNRSLAIAESYGKIPVEEFDAARAQLSADEAAGLDETFREDYEIYGAEDGVVRVTYGGSCAVCGLRLKFEHEHPLDVDGAS